MENELRKRLELLKARAKRLGGTRGAGSDPWRDEADHSLSGCAEEPPDETAESDHLALTLKEAIPGRTYETAAGSCYLAVARGETVDGRGRNEARRFERLLAGPQTLASVFGKQIREAARNVGPETVAFYDIETAGLSPSTYLFLCGVLVIRDGIFHVEQILACDYAEERAMLYRLRDLLGQVGYVVTFNGRSFDMPFTRTRMAVNRIDFTESFTTLDLLGPTRRIFSQLLPNCRLGTVEYYLTGEERTGDVPGREIPRVYHEFVRTGDARILAGVMYHNRMDLLTMVILLNEIMDNAES